MSNWIGTANISNWPPKESPAWLTGVGPVVAVTAGLVPAHLALCPLLGRGGAPVAKLGQVVKNIFQKRGIFNVNNRTIGPNP